MGRFDVCASIVDLPGIFKTTLDTIPCNVPYLKAPQPRLPFPSLPGTRFKVGFAWSGNPAQKHNFKRSCEIRCFRDVLAQPEIAFFSLQVGAAAADLERDRDIAGKVIDLGKDLPDWAETAAAIAQLDLVISVDTGVAHLAGALGKPVWLLLAQVPDARWMLQGEGSPWYPTMRLFRQNHFGDWAEVFDRVGTALKRWREEQAPAKVTHS